MHQAITVRRIAPSNTKWHRYSVFCQAKRRIYQQFDELSHDRNQIQAAIQFLHELKWHGSWYGGVVKNGDAVFVQVDDSPTDAVWIYDFVGKQLRSTLMPYTSP